jgi:hypothetical protein
MPDGVNLGPPRVFRAISELCGRSFDGETQRGDAEILPITVEFASCEPSEVFANLVYPNGRIDGLVFSWSRRRTFGGIDGQTADGERIVGHWSGIQLMFSVQHLGSDQVPTSSFAGVASVSGYEDLVELSPSAPGQWSLATGPTGGAQVHGGRISVEDHIVLVEIGPVESRFRARIQLDQEIELTAQEQ